MRGLSSLIVLTTLLVLPFSALAQGRTDQTESRLMRLENEIQTLSRAIYRGERPVQSSRFSSTQNAGSGEFSLLSQRLTSMENELRRLIGKVEEQGHRLRQLEGRTTQPASTTQDDYAVTLDLPPQAQSADTQPDPQPHQLGTLRKTDDGTVQSATINGADMNASRLYDQAFAELQNGSYERAENSFFRFLDSYPNSPLAANAQYWLAETQFIQSDFDGAARNFALGYQQFPNSPKAPDNLLKLGLSLSRLGQIQEACVTLDELFTKYPQAPRSVRDKAVSEKASLGCG